MANHVTITHKITAKSIATTIRMPGGVRITKTWHKMADNSFVLDNCNTWEDEELPEDVIREADRVPSGICALLAG